MNPLLFSIEKCMSKNMCDIDCGKTVSVIPNFNKTLPQSRSQKCITTDLGLKTVIISHISICQRVPAQVLLKPELFKNNTLFFPEIRLFLPKVRKLTLKIGQF